MPAGEAFSDTQLKEMSRAVRQAANETGLHFSVFVGDAPKGTSPRAYAERLHAALGARAADGVLVLVAPGQRQLEIVTGRESARRLADRSCGLAALSMTAAFGGGDLVGGVLQGVRMLAESAGRVRVNS